MKFRLTIKALIFTQVVLGLLLAWYARHWAKSRNLEILEKYRRNVSVCRQEFGGGSQPNGPLLYLFSFGVRDISSVEVHAFSSDPSAKEALNALSKVKVDDALELAVPDLSSDSLKSLKISSLRCLSIKGATLNQETLEVVGGLQNLQYLRLESCTITRGGLQELLRLPCLKHLDLTGAILESEELLLIKGLHLRTLCIRRLKLDANELSVFLSGNRVHRIYGMDFERVSFEDQVELQHRFGVKEITGDGKSLWRDRVLVPLESIASAMDEYEAEHGSFPPRAIYGLAGELLLSWRVALLPYLGEQELYGRFRLDEPWDSTHNAALLKDMPQAFHVWPNGRFRSKTCVQLPIIANGIWESGKLVSKKDVLDGPANTFMLILSSDDNVVEWTRPRDLVLEANFETQDALCGVNFGLGICVDGSTKTFPEATKATELEAWFTYARGDPALPFPTAQTASIHDWRKWLERM